MVLGRNVAFEVMVFRIKLLEWPYHGIMGSDCYFCYLRSEVSI